MLFTGIEDLKSVSIDYNPLKKSWKLSHKKGKKIYVIPSDKVLIKKEKLPKGVNNKQQLKRYLSVKYSNFIFDFQILKENGEFYLVLIKNYEFPKDYFALEAEPFALARLSMVLQVDNLQIIDIGRIKTTFVEVENKFLKGYRVLLKGTRYLSHRLAEEFKISPEKAETLLISEGCNIEIIKKVIYEEILSQFPIKNNVPLLLSGGGGKLKHLNELLNVEQILDLSLVDKELYPALGAALKFVYPNGSPSFRKAEVTFRDFQVFAFSSLLIIIGVFFFSLYTTHLKDDFVKKLKQKEEYLFKEKYPQLPPVAILEQLKTLKETKKNSVLPLLKKLTNEVPKGVKIYKIIYRDGKLLIQGEASKSLAQKLKNVVTIKELDNNSISFEVAVQ